ncbi:opacity-associated protein A [Providencia rustigianii]
MLINIVINNASMRTKTVHLIVPHQGGVMFRLSAFHRYGIAILALIIIAAAFWPEGDKPPANNNGQSKPIVIPPPMEPQVIPEPIITPPEQPIPAIPEGQPPTQPVVPDIIQQPAEPTQPVVQPSVTPPPTAQPTEPKPARPSANEWQNYQIQKGKTLAQLFRDNNLQANDAFIMARVEGAEKPLSNLQQGQKLRLKANGKGEVQLLEITTQNGKTYSFARLSDGTYYRTP